MEKWHVIAYCPAYNVERTLPDFLARMAQSSSELQKQGILLQGLVIADDDSTDSTPSILGSHKKQLPLTTLRNSKNMGPSATIFKAMRAAMKAAKQKKLPPAKTIFVRLDTDLEHQPEDMEKMLSPIISGRAKITAGFVPLDSRNGRIAEWFNKQIGKSESREFLGIAIPQFCPGFHAVRADAAARIYPALEHAADAFARQYKIPMLTMDIVILVLAKRLGFRPEAVRLRPIEGRNIKRFGLRKTFGYLDYHRKTVEFLREYST